MLNVSDEWFSLGEFLKQEFISNHISLTADVAVLLLSACEASYEDVLQGVDFTPVLASESTTGQDMGVTVFHLSFDTAGYTVSTDASFRLYASVKSVQVDSGVLVCTLSVAFSVYLYGLTVTTEDNSCDIVLKRNLFVMDSEVQLVCED